MKKWIFFFAALVFVAALGIQSSPGKDIAQLQPVQSVRLSTFNGYIMVETDTGAWGMGGDLDGAVSNMNATTAGQVFLDTAAYLVIAEDLLYLLPSMADHVRPSCGICVEEGQPDMTQVSAFLQIHEPTITLQEYLAGMTELPTLLTTQEGMQLVQ